VSRGGDVIPGYDFSHTTAGSRQAGLQDLADSWVENSLEVKFMTFVPIMWSVWGLTVLAMAIMFLYRSRISKDEADQIFLDDAFSREQTAQQAIQAKVKKVQPLIKVSEILAGVATLFVIGYYVNDIINQFK
jgi:hypothetical protein